VNGLDNVDVSGRLLLLFILALLQLLLGHNKLCRMKHQRRGGACCVGDTEITKRQLCRFQCAWALATKEKWKPPMHMNWFDNGCDEHALA
jgi:hypothetical protein